MLVSGCSLVVAVGLYLAWPARVTLGAPPATLTGARVVSFASGSGSVVQGWFAPGDKADDVVLLLHGYHETRKAMSGRPNAWSVRGSACC